MFRMTCEVNFTAFISDIRLQQLIELNFMITIVQYGADVEPFAQSVLGRVFRLDKGPTGSLSLASPALFCRPGEGKKAHQ